MLLFAPAAVAGNHPPEQAQAGGNDAGHAAAGNEGAGNAAAGNAAAGNEGAGNDTAGNEAAGNTAAGNDTAGNEAGDPPGNNGTVKIDGQPFDTHPDNEPHVGCVFQVDFYGYDEIDEAASVIFTAQAPTGSGEELARDTVDHGEDPHDGGGSEAGLDAELTVDLTTALAGYDAHPQQGYHVKLTVHAPGSQGADTKHKVFWVEPCEGQVAGAAEEGAARKGAARKGAAAEGAVSNGGQVETVDRIPAQVLGIVIEREAAPAVLHAADTAGAAGSGAAGAAVAGGEQARVLGLTLARTGAGLAALAAVAVGLLAAGLLLRKSVRRPSA